MHLDDALKFQNEYKRTMASMRYLINALADMNNIKITEYDRECMDEALDNVFNTEIQEAKQAVEDGAEDYTKELNSDYYASRGC